MSQVQNWGYVDKKS